MKNVLLQTAALAGSLFCPVPMIADEPKAETIPTSGAVHSSDSAATAMIPSAVRASQTVHWSDGNPGCSTLYRDGQEYKAITAHGITLLYSLEHGGDYEIANVVINNQTDHPINVLPSNFVLTTAETVVPAIAPESLSIPSARSANALGHAGLIPFLGATSITSGKLFNGAESDDYYAVTRQPGLLGRIATIAADKAERTRADKAERTRARQQSMLRANTLFPGESISGNVLFARKSANGKQTFQAILDGCTFTFDIAGK